MLAMNTSDPTVMEVSENDADATGDVPEPSAASPAAIPSVVPAAVVVGAPRQSPVQHQGEAAASLAISVVEDAAVVAHPTSMPSGEPSPSSEILSDDAEDAPTGGLGMWKKHVWTQEEDNLLLQCVDRDSNAPGRSRPAPPPCASPSLSFLTPRRSDRTLAPRSQAHGGMRRQGPLVDHRREDGRPLGQAVPRALAQPPLP